jgi:DNA-binding MarR family transcriptional regulator
MLAGKQVFLWEVAVSTQAQETELDVAVRLRAAISKLSRGLRPTQAATGLTPTQISVLVTVVLFGPLKLSELGAREGLHPTMLSRIVAQLGARGLVRRVADPDDKRAARIEPTARGKRLQETMRKQRNDTLVAELARLEPDERELILAALPALEELAERLRPLGRSK